MASIFDAESEEEIQKLADSVPDPIGGLLQVQFSSHLDEEDRTIRTVTINPVTRLEGHGKIPIFLNDEENGEKSHF